jgi:hypothetical protein
METYAVLSPRGEPRPLCPLEGGDHRHVGHVGVRAGASRPHPSLGLQNLACNREGTIPSLQKLTSDREDVPFMHTLGYRSLTALGTCSQRLLSTARMVLPIQKTLQAAKAMPASARRVTSSTGSNLTSSAEMRT